MILVTVGMHTLGFDRLIRPMDELAAQLQERVVIQRGCSSHEPQWSTHFRFGESNHMEQLTSAARLVVCHAGAGTIICSLHYQKPLVLIPRLSQFGEALDDHQLQLAEAIAALGMGVVVDEVSIRSLRFAISKAGNARIHRSTGRLQQALHRELASIMAQALSEEENR